MNLISYIETAATSDTGSTVTLDASQKSTAMNTWLYTGYNAAIEAQRGLSANTINSGSDFTLTRGTIVWSSPAFTVAADDAGSGTWARPSYVIDETESLGLDQLPGWRVAAPSQPYGLLKALVSNTTVCFPFENKVLQDNNKSKYILILSHPDLESGTRKIYRWHHTESSSVDRVNQQRITAVKNSMADYATSYYHTSVGNTSEASERASTAGTTITNNSGDY